jgi:hypothetical protein
MVVNDVTEVTLADKSNREWIWFEDEEFDDCFSSFARIFKPINKLKIRCRNLKYLLMASIRSGLSERSSPMPSLSRMLTTLSVPFQGKIQSSSSPRDPRTSTVDEPNETLPFLPPEVWALILEDIPFERLWLLRGTARMWDSIALSRLWDLIPCIRMYVTTDRGQDDHNDTIELGPADVDAMQWNSNRNNLDRRLFPQMTITWKASCCWRVQSPHYSYRPIEIFVRFAATGRKSYSMTKARCHNGPFHDSRRSETWYRNARPDKEKPSANKISRLFSKSNHSHTDTPRNQKPRKLTWKIKYVSEFAAGPGPEGDNVYRLDLLWLREVTLPVFQLACVYIDMANITEAQKFDALLNKRRL